jgi:hypothetical protein
MQDCMQDFLGLQANDPNDSCKYNILVCHQALGMVP